MGNEENFYTAYPIKKRLAYTLGIVIVAVLVAGGVYFIFFWGLTRPFGIGLWGFKLGWYS